MKKRLIILGVLGVSLIILPFILNFYSIWRFLSLIIGIIFIIIALVLFKKNIFLVSVLLILLLFLSYSLDTFMYYQFRHIPIFVYEIKSNSDVSTYNSLFYRIYKCQDEIIMDYGYKKDFVCSKNLLKKIDVNDFLKNPVDSFNNYKNKFVRIQGKISNITGKEAITLSTYEMASNNLNGYVNFNLNYNVKAIIDEDLNDYRIYDYIDIIGRVSDINTQEDKYEIILKDVNLIKSSIYNDYTFGVMNENKENIHRLIPDKNYYYYGISAINVIYDDKNIYELPYLLLDTRFTWNNLKENSLSEVIKNNLGEEVALKFTLDKYNLLECQNGKKIIINKKMKLDASICQLETP